jgi:hypothetical protein
MPHRVMSFHYEIFSLPFAAWQVQGFVSEHGNSVEVYHTLGQEQKDRLTANAQLSKHKAQ